MTTPACPYCGEAALLVDRGVVQEHHPIGFAWACLPCDAWVACHTNSQKPMGRLAKPDLHEARSGAIASFTSLWKAWDVPRKQAYLWLSHHMGIPMAECDFYKFNLEQCRKAQKLTDDYTPNFWDYL